MHKPNSTGFSDEKLRFCLELGKAMPLSLNVFTSLTNLNYLTCFKRTDIYDLKNVDVYVVLAPLRFQIETKARQFDQGDIFRVKDEFFYCRSVTGMLDKYTLTI